MENNYCSINICNKAAEMSSDFERNNSELKRLYYIRNILLYNEVVAKVEGNCGTFGTGYPFTALKSDLTGELPVLSEQIRYNDELIDAANKSKYTSWNCSVCLSQNGHIMPDLKQICKPCTRMEDELKPRKVLNRLPDIDMWMVCKEGSVAEAKEQLIEAFNSNNLKPNDTNPVQTIFDLLEISEDLKKEIMPKKLLPLDAHIIGYDKIASLIELVPFTLKQAKLNDEIPYLPIHPESYRKSWQYDDTAYNFIYDYLSAFTEFNFDGNLKQLLCETRNAIANGYSFEELYGYFVSTGTPGNRRRNSTMVMKDRFKERVDSWQR